MKKQFNFLIGLCFLDSVSFIDCMKRPREEDSNFSNKKTLIGKEKIQQEIASNFFKDFKNITKKELKGYPDFISQIKRNFGVYESFGTFKEIEKSPGLYIQILNPYLDRLNNNFTDEQSIKKIKEEIANDLRAALKKEILHYQKQTPNKSIEFTGPMYK